MNSKDFLNGVETKGKEIKNIEVDSNKFNYIPLENEQNINKNNNNLNINKKNNDKNNDNNIIDKNINDEDKIYVIINKNTEKLMNSKNKTDLIQCALEYNRYLIENIIKEKDNVTKLEYDAALNRLYQNLNILSESFELYESKYKLININGKNNSTKDNNKNNKEQNKTKEEDNINNFDRVYSNSITNIKMELPL